LVNFEAENLFNFSHQGFGADGIGLPTNQIFHYPTNVGS
jgi:hypothetical protein